MTCSVAIAWVNPFELLDPGIRALFAQTKPPMEVIVATRHPASARRALSGALPCVTLIAAHADATIPELRALAIRASGGEIVLVTEDHCVPAPDWIERAAAAIAAGADIVGGPVENACSSRLRDRAAFLTEYSGVIRPATDTVTNVIPGNNVAYRRAIALEVAGTLDSGLWESFGLASLIAGGARVVFDRDMVVHHRRAFGIRYFLGQRFHFCRAFGEMRRRSMPAGQRLAYAAASLLLPGALAARCWRNLRERRRFVREFSILSPLIFVYFCAGAVGEMLGYVFDGSGSLRRVE